MTVTRNLQVLAGPDDGTLLKVAFATSDNETVDQHFGFAKSFAIYGVNADSCHLQQMVEFAEIKDEEEDKLAEKLDLLDGCIAVYSRACGASAVRQLHDRGIQPVKVNDGSDIKELIEALQYELRDGPSSWLARAIRKHTATSGSDFTSSNNAPPWHQE